MLNDHLIRGRRSLAVRACVSNSTLELWDDRLTVIELLFHIRTSASALNSFPRQFHARPWSEVANPQQRSRNRTWS